MRALPAEFNGGRRVRGVTLIEASIVVAAVATLAALAVPRLGAAREAARSNAAHQALLASLMVAPTHAASTGAEVVVCPGTPTGCAGTHDWSGGWIVFADRDGDRVRDPASETLIHRAGPAGGRAHLRTTAGRTRLVFQPDGSASGSNVTFTLCDGRGPQRAVALVMNNTGALRATTATAAQAQACMAPM
ncbi:GspH/FimT family protein [Noviluteimonas gilva]|nr:GspH/FimT family protein [Lysobacter gilvus]